MILSELDLISIQLVRLYALRISSSGNMIQLLVHTFSASSHKSALAECVMDKYTNKFKILVAFRLSMLVSRRGKKVIILL